MTHSNQALHNPLPHSGRRARLLLVASLLALTAIGAWAAGVSGIGKTGAPGGPAPGGGGSLAFAAGGGGPVHFSGQLDRGSVLTSGDGVVKMELQIRADEGAAVEAVRVPTDLVVVLDRSGSMQGKPLHDAKAAVRELIERLDSRDRFALITYASGAELGIPMALAEAQARARFIERLASVAAGGGTNMASGIDLAVQTVSQTRESGRAPRVILLSDGHANEGDASLAGLRARAARAVPGEFVLSAVGVGEGFDENLMTALADSGTGNFYYVRHAGDLGDVFAAEFASARENVASGLSVAIEAAPGVEVLDAAGYPLERRGEVASFRPGSLFAGQERRIWVTLRAPHAEVGDFDLGRFALSYRDESPRGGGARRELAFRETPRVSCVEGQDEYFAAIDEESFVRGIAGDGLSALKQRVAAAVAAGRRGEAESAIQAYQASNKVFYDKMKIDQQGTASYRGAEELKSRVEDAFAPEPFVAKEMQNHLSKELTQEGLDGRRWGAKRGR